MPHHKDTIWTAYWSPQCKSLPVPGLYSGQDLAGWQVQKPVSTETSKYCLHPVPKKNSWLVPSLELDLFISYNTWLILNLEVMWGYRDKVHSTRNHQHSQKEVPWTRAFYLALEEFYTFRAQIKHLRGLGVHPKACFLEMHPRTHLQPRGPKALQHSHFSNKVNSQSNEPWFFTSFNYRNCLCFPTI